MPAVAPASAPLLALGGCPTAHGSWASDPCWTDRTVRAAQLEVKMASVIAIVIVIVVVTVTVITIVVVIIVVVT